jgi:hypothetical protein
MMSTSRKATTRDQLTMKDNSSTNSSITASRSKADHQCATRIGFLTDQEITLLRPNSGTTAKVTRKETGASEWMPNPDSHPLLSGSGLKKTSTTRGRCRTETTTDLAASANSEVVDENLD